jgi:nicotinate-nucleotide--dimethylbenzimidazole phosphoribosyltransferase
VLLDGLVVGAAALLADELAAGAREWWLLAQHSADPAMVLVEENLGLSPVLDLGVRLGDGTGAVAAVPLLQMAVRLLAETGSA